MIYLSRVWLTKFLPLIALVALIGCSSGQLPTAPDNTDVSPASRIATEQPTSAIRIAFTPPALSKSARPQTSSPIRTKRIGTRGGKISIDHEKTRAQFTVPRRALDKTTAISMQVHGSGPSSVVEFGPSPLYFNRPCTLSITFSSKGIDPSTLGGYLITEDGTTTEVPHRIIVTKLTITIQIQIAHFSQYTGDDGESAYSDDDYDQGDEDEDSTP